jgi:hypothetical protein
MEWRFGSFRYQAQAVIPAIDSEPRFTYVLVLFGRDPCDCEQLRES